MLKRIFLVIALLGFIASPVFAVTVDWYGVWYENRIFDNNFNSNYSQQFMGFDVQLSDVADPSSVGVSVSSNIFSSSIPYWGGGGEYYTSSSPWPPLSDWETTYNFSIDGVASPPSVTIPDGALTLLPYAIPEFNGNMASWNSVSPVAGDEVLYRVRIHNFADGSLVGSWFFDSENLSGTAYDLSFLDPGEYAIRLETRELFDGAWFNRSTSFSYFNKTNSETNPVPEPTTMLLLGAGLVGLAGFGRKRFMK